MTRFVLRGLLGRKAAHGPTAAVHHFGVAIVCGTFVLTHSITDAFNSIFSLTYKNTDAVITGKSAFNLTGTR